MYNKKAFFLFIIESYDLRSIKITIGLSRINYLIQSSNLNILRIYSLSDESEISICMCITSNKNIAKIEHILNDDTYDYHEQFSQKVYDTHINQFISNLKHDFQKRIYL